MRTIVLERTIAAPIERCFLLALSMDLHLESTAQTNETAIAGVTHGIIGPGESVTWRGRHFGVMLKHTSIISGYDWPHFFEDSMTKGTLPALLISISLLLTASAQPCGMSLDFQLRSVRSA